jgi:DNA-binding IclR family transcriptional regulator
VRVLHCFSAARPEWSLTQLAQKLDMPKSSLLNMLKTLELYEFVVKSPVTGAYRLGVGLLEFSYNARSSLPIIQYAFPFLEELHHKTGKNIYFTIPRHGKVLYLESILPSRRSIHYSDFGKTLPMHCTGCGKAMMSHLAQEEIDRIVELVGLERFTPTTITDYGKLMKELRLTRERGYAIDNSEESHGVKCVGVPIIAVGRVLGAVSISGSVLTMPDEELPEYAEMIMTVTSLMASKAELFPECPVLPQT